jgi:hypothetical protein
MPRTTGASGNEVFRILFTDTESGHNWYVGPYTVRSNTRYIRTRKLKEFNKERLEEGRPLVEGVIQKGRIVRWVEDPIESEAPPAKEGHEPPHTS